MYGFILGLRHDPITEVCFEAVYWGSVGDMYFAVQFNIDLCQTEGQVCVTLRCAGLRWVTLSRTITP
jgi:hypothetical protein